MMNDQALFLFLQRNINGVVHSFWELNWVLRHIFGIFAA